MENNIVNDSYYLISLFKRDERRITQLQVQKLMYFFEAYYMNKHTELLSLYDCQFNAWAFGPVAIPIYKEYKEFQDLDINITEEKEKIGDEISQEKKDLLQEIYNVFGGLSAMKLVNYTHMEGSPWSEKWIQNDKKVRYGSASEIDKIKSRDWFKKVFIVE